MSKLKLNALPFVAIAFFTACSKTEAPAVAPMGNVPTNTTAIAPSTSAVVAAPAPTVEELLAAANASLNNLNTKYNIQFSGLEMSPYGYETGVKSPVRTGKLVSYCRWAEVLSEELQEKRFKFYPTTTFRFVTNPRDLLENNLSEHVLKFSNTVQDKALMRFLLRNLSTSTSELTVRINDRITKLKEKNIPIVYKLMYSQAELKTLWILDSLLAYTERSPENLTQILGLGLIIIDYDSGVNGNFFLLSNYQDMLSSEALETIFKNGKLNKERIAQAFDILKSHHPLVQFRESNFLVKDPESFLALVELIDEAMKKNMSRLFGAQITHIYVDSISQSMIYEPTRTMQISTEDGIKFLKKRLENK